MLLYFTGLPHVPWIFEMCLQHGVPDLSVTFTQFRCSCCVWPHLGRMNQGLVGLPALTGSAFHRVLFLSTTILESAADKRTGMAEVICEFQIAFKVNYLLGTYSD